MQCMPLLTLLQSKNVVFYFIPQNVSVRWKHTSENMQEPGTQIKNVTMNYMACYAASIVKNTQ